MHGDRSRFAQAIARLERVRGRIEDLALRTELELVLADLMLDRDTSAARGLGSLDRITRGRGALESVLKSHAERLAESEGWTVEIDDALEAEPDASMAVDVFRIVRDALGEIRVRGGATHVDVRLEQAEGGIRIEVRDDGRVEPPARHVWLGVADLKSRLTSLGGWAGRSQLPGGCSVLECWIPGDTPSHGREGLRERELR